MSINKVFRRHQGRPMCTYLRPVPTEPNLQQENSSSK